MLNILLLVLFLIYNKFVLFLYLNVKVVEKIFLEFSLKKNDLNIFYSFSQL